MTTFFVDTSALAKRYLVESGAAWVRSWIGSSAKHEIVVAELARIEMLALLSRHRRYGSLSETITTRLQNTFLRHFRAQYLVVSLDRPILLSASRLVNRHPLRTLDAIQLACALQAISELRVPVTFISADHNLPKAAAAEGFAVDNPNDHP